jgi:hypothetical protein
VIGRCRSESRRSETWKGEFRRRKNRVLRVAGRSSARRHPGEAEYHVLGVPEPHHPLTHHQGNPEKMDKCAKIQRYHIALFTEYLEKLRNTPDGDGSLLDHVILLFGSGISNSDRHTHGPLPTFLVGGGAGTLRGGRHLVYPEHTPLTNLQVTLLNKLGVPAEKLGESNGEFKELSDLS